MHTVSLLGSLKLIDIEKTIARIRSTSKLSELKLGLVRNLKNQKSRNRIDRAVCWPSIRILVGMHVLL